MSTSCLVCRQSMAGASFDAEERMFGIGDRFTYVVCDACGSVQQSSPPSDLGRYYPDTYYSVSTDPEQLLGRFGMRQFVGSVCRSALTGGQLAKVAATIITNPQFRTLVRILESMRRAGADVRATRALDVGCGSGVLVYALSLAGMRHVAGVDPFATDDREFDTGALVLKQGLESTAGEWDLIMFHHSFEHLDRPDRTLERCRSLLAPGGAVLIRAPTVSSWAWEEYGTYWLGLDAPRHIFVPSRRGIELLAERTGFRVEDIVDDSTDAQFWGSEQYRRGTALMSETSHAVSRRRSAFSRREIAEFRRRTEVLNAQQRGDQAAFYLRVA